jgi:hypothetical protein
MTKEALVRCTKSLGQNKKSFGKVMNHLKGRVHKSKLEIRSKDIKDLPK